jgi:hypothetical protein
MAEVRGCRTTQWRPAGAGISMNWPKVKKAVSRFQFPGGEELLVKIKRSQLLQQLGVGAEVS